LQHEPDTQSLIVPHDREEHRQWSQDPNVVYLRMVDHRGDCGFIILALDHDGHSVELRCIVLSKTQRGRGQAAIVAAERWIRQKTGRGRIWLDVSDFNSRAQLIYEGLGYHKYGNGVRAGKSVLLYEKHL